MLPEQPGLLRILSWNVRRQLHVLHADATAMHAVNQADVLLFTEAGMQPHHPIPIIPGFHCVKCITSNGGHHDNSVACYVRTCRVPYVKHVCSRPGACWVSIQLPGRKQLFVAVCYMPHMQSVALRPNAESTGRSTTTAPQRRAALQELYEQLRRECYDFARSGDIIITGDLNARTGTAPELPAMMTDEWAGLAQAGVPLPESVLHYHHMLQVIPARVNTDVTCDAAGRMLLEFAAEQGLVIANGRLPGDLHGACTFQVVHNHRTKRSTVDYCLVSPDLVFDDGGQCSAEHALDVLEEARDDAGIFFDHAPVVLKLVVSAQENTHRLEAEGELQGQACARYQWKDEKQGEYVGFLRQWGTQQRLADLAQPDVDSSAAAAGLAAVLTEVADKLQPRRYHTQPSGRARRRQHRQPHKPWYDQECRRLRELARHSPTGSAVRMHYLRYVRSAKRAYTEQSMNDMVCRWYKDARCFWQDYKAKRKVAGPGGMAAWTAYFKNLYNVGSNEYQGGTLAEHTAHFVDLFGAPSAEHTQAGETLNRCITEDEVAYAMSKLQDNKAAGVDGLPGEFLSHATYTDEHHRQVNVLVPVITAIFNKILHGTYPVSWAHCAISPVFKGKGDARVMDNYRGIAVGTALSKLYSQVLLARLDAWAETGKWRAKGQAGFRAGRGAVDNIFVLNHVLERAKARHKAVYAAFIDFRKAYDSVNRSLLWSALQGMGIHGSMLATLQSMYAAVGMQVRVNGSLGELFAAETGVKQGDPLSPLLFGLYIDRLEKYMLSKCDGGVELSDTAQLQSLLYADDLTLLAHDSNHLQHMLDTLHDFCKACHLTVNVDKSVVVMFNRRGQNPHFTYAGGALPAQPAFTYLGVSFDSRTSRADILKSSLQKARAALHGMVGRCREIGMYNVMIQCNLFNTLVASVLNYGCPVWSVYHMHTMQRQGWTADSSVEDLQLRFLRMATQVPKSTTKAILMNETRRVPLLHAWFKQTITWYNQVVGRAADDLTKVALHDSIKLAADGMGCGSCWGSAFLTSVKAVAPDMQQLVTNVLTLPLAQLIDTLHRKWYEHAWGNWAQWDGNVTAPRTFQDRDGFKRVTYRSWFCHGSVHDNEPPHCPHHARHGFAHHLNRPEHVRMVASFRMQAHTLNIEQHRINRAERLCECCRDVHGSHACVEDEMHLLECPAYEQVRLQFADVLGDVATPMTDSAMYTVMNPTQPTQWRRLATFLQHVFELRSSLLLSD